MVHAYKTSAADALSSAVIIEKEEASFFKVVCSYEKMNDVVTILKSSPINIATQHFDNDCSFEIEVPKSVVDSILDKLNKVSSTKKISLIEQNNSAADT